MVFRGLIRPVTDIRKTAKAAKSSYNDIALCRMVMSDFTLTDDLLIKKRRYYKRSARFSTLPLANVDAGKRLYFPQGIAG
jgi:hypothetical protein